MTITPDFDDEHEDWSGGPPPADQEPPNLEYDLSFEDYLALNLIRRSYPRFRGRLTSWVLVAGGAHASGNTQVLINSCKGSPYWEDRGLLETALDEFRQAGACVETTE